MGDFRRRIRLLSAGKSPSTECMKRTYRRAVLNGGVTQDFSINVENIREICRKLSYVDGNVFFRDAPFVYVPSSYGEGKNFAQVHNKRNLNLWSEDYTQTQWGKVNTTISANTNLNPFGINKSYYIVESATNTNHSIINVISITIGLQYTTSYYVKKADASWVQFGADGALLGSANWINFNFDTGSFGNAGGLGKWSSEALLNGWWKITNTSTALGSGAAQTGIIIGCNNTNSATRGLVYIGTGSRICDTAAAQFEQNFVSTPYQKTVASGDGIVDFNFTRATSARVTNKQGVIEDSCYNLCPQSETLDNAAWSKNSVTASYNAAVAPNGALTADNISNIISTSSNVRQIVSLLPNTTYTVSVYGKSVAGNSLVFFEMQRNSVFTYTQFDTLNGTMGGSIPVGGTTAVEVLPNGWYRGSVTFTTASGGTNEFRSFYIGATGSSLTLTTMSLWGAQIVIGSTPRPYLRTTNRLNVPRLDYSRGTGEPELLIERASTNTWLDSENFAAGNWQRQGVTLSTDTTTSVFDNRLASKVSISDNASSAVRRLFANGAMTLVLSSIYTVSFYVKKAELNYLMFRSSHTGPTSSIGFTLNLTTAAITQGYYDGATTSAMPTSVNATIRPDGWIYVQCTFTTPTTNSIPYFYLSNTVNTTSTINLSGQGVYICCPQFELDSRATTYIPTTTAAVTRNAETSYVDLWNNSLLSRTNFTLYAEGYLYDGQTTGMSICLSDTSTAASNTNQIGWYSLNTPFFNIGTVRTNGTSNAANNSYNKFAIQYNNGTVNFYRNGVNVWASQTVAVFDYRYLVVNSGNSTFTVDKIALFNRTLTNSEMVLLTT